MRVELYGCQGNLEGIHAFKSESNGPVHFFLGLLLTVTDVSTTCAAVIFRVKSDASL